MPGELSVSVEAAWSCRYFHDGWFDLRSCRCWSHVCHFNSTDYWLDAWTVVGEAIRSCKILFCSDCLWCFLFWSHFLVHLITSRRRMTKDTISMISQMGYQSNVDCFLWFIAWFWLSFFLHMIYSLAGLVQPNLMKSCDSWISDAPLDTKINQIN